MVVEIPVANAFDVCIEIADKAIATTNKILFFMMFVFKINNTWLALQLLLYKQRAKNIFDK
jgi:hypothetical protein